MANRLDREDYSVSSRVRQPKALPYHKRIVTPYNDTRLAPPGVVPAAASAVGAGIEAGLGDSEDLIEQIAGEAEGLFSKYSGKGWPSSPQRLLHFLRRGKVITTKKDIPRGLVNAAAKLMKSAPEEVRTGEAAGEALGRILSAMQQEIKGGAKPAAALASTFGIAKSALGRAFDNTGKFLESGRGIAATIGGGLLLHEIGSEIKDVRAARNVQDTLARKAAGENTVLPSAEDLFNENKLAYLQNSVMAKQLAGDQGGSSVMAALIRAQSKQQTPGMVSVPGSMGFPR